MDNKEIAHALKQIEDRKGRLTATAVVEAAADPEHPLHKEFEWDDTEAARKFRIEQARGLIARVRVIIEVQDRVMKTAGYLRDPSMPHNEQGYRSTAKIAREPDEARAALVAEFARAAGHLKRARDLAAAFGLFDEISNLVDAVDQISARVHPTQEQVSA